MDSELFLSVLGLVTAATALVYAPLYLFLRLMFGGEAEMCGRRKASVLATLNLVPTLSLTALQIVLYDRARGGTRDPEFRTLVAVIAASMLGYAATFLLLVRAGYVHGVFLLEKTLANLVPARDEQPNSNYIYSRGGSGGGSGSGRFLPYFVANVVVVFVASMLVTFNTVALLTQSFPGITKRMPWRNLFGAGAGAGAGTGAGTGTGAGERDVDVVDVDEAKSEGPFGGMLLVLRNMTIGIIASLLAAGTVLTLAKAGSGAAGAGVGAGEEEGLGTEEWSGSGSGSGSGDDDLFFD